MLHTDFRSSYPDIYPALILEKHYIPADKLTPWTIILETTDGSRRTLVTNQQTFARELPGEIGVAVASEKVLFDFKTLHYLQEKESQRLSDKPSAKKGKIAKPVSHWIMVARGVMLVILDAVVFTVAVVVFEDLGIHNPWWEGIFLVFAIGVLGYAIFLIVSGIAGAIWKTNA